VVELRPLRTGVARLMIPPERRRPEDALQWLEGLLMGGEPGSRIGP
jgi:hypothetical protein